MKADSFEIYKVFAFYVQKPIEKRIYISSIFAYLNAITFSPAPQDKPVFVRINNSINVLLCYLKMMISFINFPTVSSSKVHLQTAEKSNLAQYMYINIYVIVNYDDYKRNQQFNEVRRLKRYRESSYNDVDVSICKLSVKFCQALLTEVFSSDIYT